MKNIFISFLAGLLLSSCHHQITGDEIISQSINAHGGEVIDTATIAFDFRKIHYQAYHSQGVYRYERWRQDSIHDVLDNEGFTRFVNNEQVILSQEDEQRYGNSVNSVIYFALLPYKLNDPAANVQLQSETTIEGQPYYEVKVTFDKQGGGSDHEDVFAYWIHKNNFTMDYLAYLYHVNEGGTRFRKAFNRRNVNGILVADYENYEGPYPYDVTDLDSLYSSGQLKMLSKIELENVKVF